MKQTMKRTWLRPIGLILLASLLVGGCSSRAMDDFDRHPAQNGLLMMLQKASMTDPLSNGYQVKVKMDNNGSANSHDTTLTLQVLDPSGQPAKKFTEDMTKLMHLVVVSRDLSAFAHIHPDYQGNGTFVIKHQFPFAGDFQLIEEFVPNDQDITICKQWVTVSGTDATPHHTQKLTPDMGFTKKIDGVEVTLSASTEMQEIKAGDMVMLNFHLVDGKTHQPVQIEPYLGTSGNCVILDSTDTHYLHVHPMDSMTGGADVMFHTQFPTAGVYKIWGQFNIAGNVIAFPFVVNVK